MKWHFISISAKIVTFTTSRRLLFLNINFGLEKVTYTILTFFLILEGKIALGKKGGCLKTDPWIINVPSKCDAIVIFKSIE